MTLDKRILTVLASLFVVALASSGDTPEDPVFYCLNGLSGEIRSCYKKAYRFQNSRRGGPLGGALAQLRPTDYRTWPAKNDSQRAQACITSLKNFVAPLKAVIESEKGSKKICHGTGDSLNKKLDDLLRVLSNSIIVIRRHVRRKGIYLRPLQLTAVNMTSMTSLAAGQLRSHHGAVRLRNFVLLDYLDQVLRDIYVTKGSCFNTEIDLHTACPV